MSAKDSNMKYLGLNEKQYAQHVKYMAMPMNEWPQTLLDDLRAHSKEYGFSGDGMACVVADFIKWRTSGK